MLMNFYAQKKSQNSVNIQLILFIADSDNTLLIIQEIPLY